MNWGRKKTSASSAPERGVKSIAKMFPVSWFSRLRQGHGNENRSLRKVKKDVGLQEDRSCRVEKFYGETEEHFWRLSFEDEGVQGRKCRRGCPGSVSYGWHDDIELSPSTCRSCGAKDNIEVGKNESMDFSHMVLDLKKTRDTNRHVQAERETNGQITRGARNSKVLRRAGKLENLDLHQLRYGPSRVVNYASLKGADRKMVGEKEVLGDPNIQNSAVKDIMEVDAVKPIQTSIRISRRSQSSSTSQKHHHEASTHSKLQGSECENFGKINLAETGEERKSIYISKDSQKRRSKSGRSSKAKIYSPRTPSKAELCKIRALEDLKKTRMKTRAKEKEEKEKTLLESFAVVKCSFDPQKDFRNSMLEMIIDKGISKPEELEELLVCYLILNSDEYHDMIIKSFRQVWFDLNKDRLNPPLRDAERCNN